MQIIAHRGASGSKPENTLAAFQEAISCGVDMIELDVHVAKTGEVVILHDYTVGRTTNGRGRVANMSFSALRSLDAGGGEKIPLLTEVLDLVDRRLPVNIELKGRGTAKPVAKIIKQYTDKKKWSRQLFIVSSFLHKELDTFQALLPHITVSHLCSGKGLACRYDRSEILSENLTLQDVSMQKVAAAHMQGRRVFVYTVNTAREKQRMQRMQVDGIFTDFPRKLSGTPASTR